MNRKIYPRISRINSLPPSDFGFSFPALKHRATIGDLRSRLQEGIEVYDPPGKVLRIRVNEALDFRVAVLFEQVGEGFLGAAAQLFEGKFKSRVIFHRRPGDLAQAHQFV